MWPRATLRQVAPPERADTVFAADDVVWQLSLDQIESQTGRILKKVRARAADAGTSTFAFDAKHVLYSKLRPYLNKVARPDEPGLATTELVPLRPVPGVLNADFLTFYLRSDAFVNFANLTVAGAKMPRMIMDRFWEHRIPVPAPREQRRIVELLEQADALRRQRAEADSLAEQILPALFREMFGDPATNSRRLATEKLEVLATVQRGDFRHRPRTEPRFYGGPYPFIQINDITAAHYVIRSYSQTLNEDGLAISRMFPAGTVVLSIAATIAASGILGFDSCFPDSLVGVRSRDERTTQEFLFFYLRLVAQQLSANAPQLAQKNINLQILNALDVPLPADEPLQAFTTSARRVIALDEEQRVSHENIETLFQTMLHRAFTGELTSRWREAHMEELLVEMEQQARFLKTSGATL